MTHRWIRILFALVFAVAPVAVPRTVLRAQPERVQAVPPPASANPFADLAKKSDADADVESGPMDWHWSRVIDAAIALPVATLLGAMLALRPRRRGTPNRSAPIVQTQIILAVIGALVMLVVGSSLARAFGVVGAAGLVRYRARVQDPKDAGVMLSTLAIGLSAGVGLYVLSAFAAAFIMAVLWIIESFEPEAHKFFQLKVATKTGDAVQEPLEALLRRQHAGYELRASSAEELSYQVRLPMQKGTAALTKAILELPSATAVDWEEEKKKPADET